MLLSAFVSIIYNDGSTYILMYSAILAALFGVFPLIFVPPAEDISNNEGLIIVVASWLISCLIGAIPYVLWGVEFSFSNAWFESVSGFTTTGSTILVNIEAVPKGLLFWRAMTHWLGGMGIFVFALSVMPFMGEGMRVLYQSEMSALALNNFQQRAKIAVNILASVYVGLTALETIALLFCGMDLFDAITHSFATIATGGFSPRNASVAYFNSISIEMVIMIFMIFSGIHFALLFGVISGDFKSIWKSWIVRYYLLALFAGITISSIDLYITQYDSFAEALRHASFQMLSVGTSTGFATADSSIWSPVSQMLLIFFRCNVHVPAQLPGNKADRIVILGKSIMRQIRQLQHPRAVLAAAIGDRVLEKDVARKRHTVYRVLYLYHFCDHNFVGLPSAQTQPKHSPEQSPPWAMLLGLGGVGSVGNFQLHFRCRKMDFLCHNVVGTVGNLCAADVFYPQTLEIMSRFLFPSFSPR
ncbi:MAG: potassium transporter TrkG [Calditrichia bacterium]